MVCHVQAFWEMIITLIAQQNRLQTLEMCNRMQTQTLNEGTTATKAWQRSEIQFGDKNT